MKALNDSSQSNQSPRPLHSKPRLHFLPRDEENEALPFQSGRYTDILLLELEDNEIWPDLEARATSYDRVMFTDPYIHLRTFCIILAFSYKTNELRCIIFHRDGLYTTHSLNIMQSEDRRSVRTFLYSALSRQSLHDAKLPGFIKVQKVGLEVDEGVYDQNGVHEHLLGTSMHPLDGTPTSRDLFLPASFIITGVGDRACATSAHESSRTLSLTFCEVRKSLTTCKYGKELLECIPHAMLGWIHWFWAGFLHRDISISTILRLDHPVECRPFVVPSLNELFEPFDGLASLADPASEGLPSLSGNSQADVLMLRDEVDVCRKTLEERVRELGLGQTCRAVLLDSDGAADLTQSNYFKDKCPERIVGTLQFRSIPFIAAVADGTSYLQSPVDDLESFVWTTLWALVYHPEQKDRLRWRKWLYGGGNRTTMLREVRLAMLQRKNEFGPILCDIGSTLHRLHQSVQEIQDQWTVEIKAVDRGGIPEVELAVRKHILFHKYALRGLVGAIYALGLDFEGREATGASEQFI